MAELTGLEHAVNLVELDFAGNPVGDLAPLASLPRLEVLGLERVRADRWPLSRLPGLRRLSLHAAGVADLWPLGGLTDLQVLDLSDNPVTDLTPVAWLPGREALRVDGGADRTTETRSGKWRQQGTRSSESRRRYRP